MKNVHNLEDRVGSAIDRLTSSEQHRREQNRNLSRVLADLEVKFEARTSELDHCRERIEKLEQSNRSLTGVVGELLQVMENTANTIADDPVYRASNAAAEILDRYGKDVPVADVSGSGAAVVGLDGTFEDVETEFLVAEGLYEKTEGAETFPALVYDAMTLAQSDEETLETQDDAGEFDGDLDIREIKPRLEIAAERAQLNTEAAQPERRSEPEELDRAVGGRA